MTGLQIALLCGLMGGVGLFLIWLGASRRTVRLSDAIAILEGTAPQAITTARPDEAGMAGVAHRMQSRLRLPLTATQQQRLLQQDRSVGDFFAEKILLALVGSMLPVMWLAGRYLMGASVSPLPMLLGVVGALVGYFIPDWRLRRGAERAKNANTESIHTFFDLVVLERLANVSATQAVTSAAAISDTPLYRRISAALELARLEQSPPWEQLERVATEWQLPELADFTEIMKLEQQGAALSDALRARVRELRNAHLAALRTRTQEQTEGLTLWMTVPALLLGVAFILPPLLRLAGA